MLDVQRRRGCNAYIEHVGPEEGKDGSEHRTHDRIGSKDRRSVDYVRVKTENFY
jgi:hypothetical protein